MRAYTASQASAIHSAPTYLTIRNLSGEPDELLSVRPRSPARVVLTGPPGRGGGGPPCAGLAIPADGSITLTPLSAMWCCRTRRCTRRT